LSPSDTPFLKYIKYKAIFIKAQEISAMIIASYNQGTEDHRPAGEALVELIFFL